MASQKLTWMKVRNAKPGMLGDGAGLWLHTTSTGTRSWIFRYTIAGRQREMGLGALGPISRPTVGLDAARDHAAAARRQIRDGIDPLAARQSARAAKRAQEALAVTFADAAGQYIAAHRDGWRNAEHARQWVSTLETYVAPVIGALPVAAIETSHVLDIIKPLWVTRTETASRVRSRIELVIDYATAHGWRAGANPARWRGHLDAILPAKAKAAPVIHHQALDWREMPSFMTRLVASDSPAARALAWTILTAARAGETLGGAWGEIDEPAVVWSLPAARMKAGREHRVPLSPAALALLEPAGEPGELLFPGVARAGMRRLLATLDAGVTVHGMRSAFSTWAAETGQPSDLVEAALAHQLGSRVAAAYQRGDLLTRRRHLMSDWANYCLKK